MTPLFIAALLGGFGLTIYASRQAVGHARIIIEATSLPPFIVGITLFAIGTDLPEIANSIAASLSGHGDINIGDSVGSAATQMTLILGLLPLLVGAFVVGRRRVGNTGSLTVVALLFGAALFADGFISRLDAVLLIGSWIVGAVLIWRDLPPGAEPVMRIQSRRTVQHAVLAMLMLAGVGLGASAAVWGLVGVARQFDAPEYTLAFVVAAIGTSLPELVVSLTALRGGARDLAIGDVMGSSFADATLSISMGPLIAPTVVTASFAVRGSLIAASLVVAVVAMLAFTRRHNRVTGIIAIGLWFVAYGVLIS